MLRWMGIGSLDLYKALGANGLIAASRLVKIGRVVEEANRALGCVFVKEDFDALAIDVPILGQLDLLWGHLGLRIVT
jgi:hypothetical protein